MKISQGVKSARRRMEARSALAVRRCWARLTGSLASRARRPCGSLDFTLASRAGCPGTSLAHGLIPQVRPRCPCVAGALVPKVGSCGLSLACTLALCLFLLVAAPGCGRRDAGITFMAGGEPNEIAYWETLIDEFERQSGVQVRLIRQPADSDQRREQLVVPLRSGKGDPDVFLMDVVWVAQLAASGWLEPLDRYAAEDAFSLDPFFAGVVDLADRYRGTLFALPVYVDGGLLYYRKDLLAEYGISGPPRTWDELVRYSLKVQEGERAGGGRGGERAGKAQEGEAAGGAGGARAGNAPRREEAGNVLRDERSGGVRDRARAGNESFYGFLWQGAQYEGLVCDFMEFAASSGAWADSSGGSRRFDGPAYAEALRFMRDLIHVYKISPPNTYTEMREEQCRIAFQAGNALFERNWPYAWVLHEGADSPVRGRVGIARLPHFPGGRSVSALGGWHAGMSRSSDRKRQSWRFMKFIASYDAQKKLALNLGWNPARTDIYEDTAVIEKIPHLRLLKGIFENAVSRPRVPYYSQVSDMLQRHLNACLSGKVDEREALDAIRREAETLHVRYGEKR